MSVSLILRRLQKSSSTISLVQSTWLDIKQLLSIRFLKRWVTRFFYAVFIVAYLLVGTQAAFAQSELALQYERYTIGNDDNTAEVCLDFNETILPDQAFATDFVRIDPKPTKPLTITTDGWDDICLTGLDYAQTYEITLYPGLMGEDNIVLDRVQRIQINTGQRASDIWFDSRSYVLPAKTTPQFPITSINIDSFDVSLYRLLPSNLMDSWLRDNFQDELDGSDLSLIENQLGELVWEGQLDAAAGDNVPVTTSLPVSVLSDSQKPGLYVLVASDADSTRSTWRDLATQWLIRSDIGLSSYISDAGMSVFARSLSTAEPIANAKVALIAKNNTILATQQTDVQGRVHFAAELISGRGGNSPYRVQVTQPDRLGDLAFLSLVNQPLDLTDRGIDGIRPLEQMNVYAYTERGIYRRGESVNVVALLRNQQAKTLSGTGFGAMSFPLRYQIIRPDQTLMREQVLIQAKAGGYHLTHALSDSAQSGRWTINFLGSEQADDVLGSVSFLVADIVPPRIEINYQNLPDAVNFYQGATLEAQANYLFGAPAAGLTYKAVAALRADPTPFEKYPAFSFGNTLADNTPRKFELTSGKSSEQGEMQITFHQGEESTLDQHDVLAVPMQLRLRTEIQDVNGRAVSKLIDVPLITEPAWVGIKALVAEQASSASRYNKDEIERVNFSQDALQAFEVRTVNARGQSVQLRDMRYRLVKQDYFSQWYRNRNGDWVWERDFYDTGMETGAVSFSEKGLASLAFNKDWGYYRLEILDETEEVKAVMAFRVGWTQNAQLAGTPDAVEISANASEYQVGETARLQIKPPFSGPVQVLLAKDGDDALQVLAEQHIDVANGQHGWELEVPISDDWVAGAYVLVTAYRADNQAEAIGPDRAIGAHWIAVDHSDQALQIELDAPDRLKSSERLQIPIRIDNASAQAGSVFVTVAAVDEGVLQLDNHENPSAFAHFFAKYQLPVVIRDLYAYLIDTYNGVSAAISSGGDEGDIAKAANDYRPDTDIQITSLFSGIVDVVDGQATVAFDLPDFNGELRLMSVAWNDRQYGQVSTSVKVADPLVALLTKPRFLALDDMSSMTVQLFNQTRPETSYTVEMRAETAGLDFIQPVGTSPVLAPGENTYFTLPVIAKELGSHEVTLLLKGDDGYTQEKQFMLAVRPPYTPLKQQTQAIVQANSMATLGENLISQYDPSTFSGHIMFANSPTFGLLGQLEALDAYPYGCLEQVTSKSMPMLFFDILASRTDYQTHTPAEQRVRDGIGKIFDKQLTNGGFGLWTNRNDVDAWASVYAIDFLLRAAANGVVLPEQKIQRAMDWLSEYVREPIDDSYRSLPAKAYAHYVLAKAGFGYRELLQRRYDRYQANIAGRLEAAFFAAALHSLGDDRLALQAFELAFSMDSGSAETPVPRTAYGSEIRDTALKLALLFESGLDKQINVGLSGFIGGLSAAVNDARWLSTQERVALVLAAIEINDEQGAQLDNVDVEINGELFDALSIGQTLPLDVGMQQDGVEIVNHSDQAVWAEMRVDGITSQPPAAQNNGISVDKMLLNRDLSPAQLDNLQQGEIYYVAIRSQINVGVSGLGREMLLVDFLPAGFEIENADIKNTAADLPEELIKLHSRTKHVEALDDRYVASFSLSDQYEESTYEFYQVYVVRAVSVGDYVLPNATVEDMYAPAVRGSSAVKRIRIR